MECLNLMHQKERRKFIDMIDNELLCDSLSDFESENENEEMSMYVHSVMEMIDSMRKELQTKNRSKKKPFKPTMKTKRF